MKLLSIIPKPFVLLRYQFDLDALQKEVLPLLEQQWLAHPQGFEGNQTLPLVSVRGQYNHEFANAGQMLPTPALAQCHYIRQILSKLDVPISRTRLMRLDAGARVSRHYDAGYHWYKRIRIHVPIFTHPDVIFGCADKQQHMKAGEAWCFDHRQWHWVQNNSPYPRVHLVIDTKGTNSFISSLSEENPSKEYFNSVSEHSKSFRLEPYRYEVLEPRDLSLILEPFKSLSITRNSNPLREDLVRFKLNWKCVFKQYGHHISGEKEYRKLIQRFVDIAKGAELGESQKASLITLQTMLSEKNGIAIPVKIKNDSGLS